MVEPPTSRAKISRSGQRGPPPTPSGYRDPYPFRYSRLLLFIGSVPLTIIAGLVFGWILIAMQGIEILPVVIDGANGEIVDISINISQVGLSLLLSIGIVAILHELTHGLVYEYVGYDVSYGIYWSMGAVYTGVFGQFQSREENIRAGIAPLIALTLVFLPLLAVPHSLVATTALFVLILNAGGSIGDLYAIWRLRQLPEGTLTFSHDLHEMYVFEPLRD